jgi:hypothetical protein
MELDGARAVGAQAAGAGADPSNAGAIYLWAQPPDGARAAQ